MMQATSDTTAKTTSKSPGMKSHGYLSCVERNVIAKQKGVRNEVIVPKMESANVQPNRFPLRAR